MLLILYKNQMYTPFLGVIFYSWLRVFLIYRNALRIHKYKSIWLKWLVIYLVQCDLIAAALDKEGVLRPFLLCLIYLFGALNLYFAVTQIKDKAKNENVYIREEFANASRKLRNLWIEVLVITAVFVAAYYMYGKKYII